MSSAKYLLSFQLWPKGFCFTRHQFFTFDFSSSRVWRFVFLVYWCRRAFSPLCGLVLWRKTYVFASRIDRTRCRPVASRKFKENGMKCEPINRWATTHCNQQCVTLRLNVSRIENKSQSDRAVNGAIWIYFSFFFHLFSFFFFFFHFFHWKKWLLKVNVRKHPTSNATQQSSTAHRKVDNYAFFRLFRKAVNTRSAHSKNMGDCSEQSDEWMNNDGRVPPIRIWRIRDEWLCLLDAGCECGDSVIHRLGRIRSVELRSTSLRVSIEWRRSSDSVNPSAEWLTQRPTPRAIVPVN